MNLPATSEGYRTSSKITGLRAQSQNAGSRSQLTQQNTVEFPMTEILRIQQKIYGADDHHR